MDGELYNTDRDWSIYWSDSSVANILLASRGCRFDSLAPVALASATTSSLSDVTASARPSEDCVLSLSCITLGVYMHVFSIVLGCLSVGHVYFSLVWGSECQPRSWMVRVSHLRDLMRSIVRLLLKPQTTATVCKFDWQWSYLQTYEEGLFGA